MKMLHYAALEPVQRLRPLQSQAYESLKPSLNYLRAAIRAALDRQTRYRVGWERPEIRRPIRLSPMDSVFEVRPLDGRFVVTGLPVPESALTLPPKLIVQWTTFLDLLTVEVVDGRVLVTLDSPPAEEAELSWAGVPVQIAPAAVAPPPREAFDSLGQPLDFVDVRSLPEGGYRVVVAGAKHERIFNREGEPLAARRVPWNDSLRSIDGAGSPLTFAESLEFDLPELPTRPVLRGDNGVRFAWEPVQKGRPVHGEWVQLVPLSDADGDVGVDPRAAFCEEGVREVRIEGRPPVSLRVNGYNRESWQIALERLPPDGAVLQLSVNVHNLRRQREAVETLCHAPQPHHRGLLRLLESPTHAAWPSVGPAPVDEWHLLTDPSTDGTAQQREFVERALATPDFAFLEGPPGSGKTHAICELVLQLIEQGLRVLLCSTTHVAVDNVLERLVGQFADVEAVRIGDVERVDERVRSCQLGARIDALLEAWPADERTDAERRRAAESLTLAAANLTCGTTTGILAHPLLRQAGGGDAHFDVLILDEASKTTFQEFLVPAIHARRWIVVGDVRQLPPFTERHDLEASLEELSDGEAKRLTTAYQRGLLLWFRLTSRLGLPGQLRWLVCEDDAVLDAIVAEAEARAGQADPQPTIVRIVGRTARNARELSTASLGEPTALRLFAADWVLVSPQLLTACEARLPPDLLSLGPAPGSALREYRQAHWRPRNETLRHEVKERGKTFTTVQALQEENRAFLSERTWPGEVGWRLGRFQQLSQAKNAEPQERIGRDIARLSPQAPALSDWTRRAMFDLLDVGMRSIIESLRLGRPEHGARRESALTEALPEEVWRDRAVLLSFQHRMDPEISRFPREVFYEDKALRDANTLSRRAPFFFGGFPSRRTWIDVDGRESRGANLDEIRAIRAVLERWRRECPGARPDGRPWEIACLAFYNRQELALRDMLREVTGQRSRQTRFELPHTELVCATVDRFQGREADLVLLSLRNTNSRRIGHLDSPNRMNVALTRGRRQLLVVGRNATFRDCGFDELEALAKDTLCLNSSAAMSGRAGPVRH